MKMKCLIVEDEPLARNILIKYIAAVDSLELIKACKGASDAISVLHQHNIDLMFLDIKMPEISGLEFLDTLQNPPKVIITTAHLEYAIEGYEYSVIDFLLKPFPFERFLKAVNKAFVFMPEDVSTTITSDIHNNHIFLKADRTLHKVLLSEINYIQGFGNYLKVFTLKRMILVADTMSNMEERLPSRGFRRVHKSYIVSLKNIEKVGEGFINIGSKEIPIGNLYKNQFYKALKNFD